MSRPSFVALTFDKTLRRALVCPIAWFTLAGDFLLLLDVVGIPAVFFLPNAVKSSTD